MPMPHPTRGEIRVIAPTATLSRTPGRLERPLGAVGEDTDGVLAEFAYGPQEIGRLREQGVV